ncbi:MAG: site-specific DNA-methyltransferase, partial [Spirochaetaceae bacterium]|nr:site-specific DNA-methyltransferase [Spirochaetaceae bacterium]
MSQQLDRFTGLLENIFEIKKSDLDFGIYRILNIRRKEILQFLREDLPVKVKAIIAPDAEDREKLRAEKAQLEKQAYDFGVKVEKTKKAGRYAELKYLLAQGADLESLEADVYSHLYNFFNRYYEEGDFISKRRYREGVYAIPYEGEEVKLYWANHDQYYIKTGENFRDYSFKAEGKTVHFRTVNASTEQNNNKENGVKRCFMLMPPSKNAEHKTIEANGDDTELTIHFVYGMPEEKRNYNEENYSAMCTAIAKRHKAWLFLTEAPKDQMPLLEKHYNAYVAKNSFDYFIHKDLQGFLTRELDFYIKNEVIHLDDIETANEKRMGFWLAKARAIKHIGGIVIRFLARIEEFQKKLWLKKKFIVDTGWCITLDKIPPVFYEEIRKNKAQVQEWIDLYAVDDLNGNGELGLREKFTKPPKPEFLEQNQNLPVDTKHFSREFTERLVASIDKLDAETNGVLIHGENFQALNLLQERYREKVDCIYIDPPYNTSASEILYKNGYKDSSWLSMIFDRCDISKRILRDDGVFAFAIDDTEEKYAHNLLDTVFGKNELGTVVVRNNPSGRPMKTGFAVSHEYTLFYSKNPDVVVSKIERDESLDKRYKEQDENGYFMWELLRKRGSDSERADSPKAYYPFYYDGKTFRLPKMKWNDFSKTWEIIEEPKKNEIVCWPIDENGIHRRWRWGVETAMENLPDLLYKENGAGTVYYKYRPPEGLTVSTNWIDSKYSSTEHGTGYLKKMFTDYTLFSYPKSIYAVEDSLRVMGLKNNCLALDYFAGSGTTGHAVINLNRQDGGGRKYILVEMGEYFDTVT